jgi:hypothetical protein
MLFLKHEKITITILYANKHKKRIQGIRLPTNNWRQRKTEHRRYTESATDITTQNSERKDT